jgi:hypothetical protein
MAVIRFAFLAPGSQGVVERSSGSQTIEKDNA